ncbi:MAG: hypothetical protein M5U34_31805 [Chloroflexi bacterium]|nr:hypothetical protein [Chloroflexota bacterium]
MIGVDVLGRDWGQVNQWAALRTANGNPDPVDLRYWEIGNEVYAGKPGMGAECDFEWGWEDVWTCDGAEYVAGIGSGENRKDGFLDYVAAMKAVDPTILIGAVGVDAQDAWSDWGHEVLAGAGEAMDFYVIHHYGFFDPPATYEAVLALPQAVWEPLAAGVAAALETEVPIAITEYNLFFLSRRRQRTVDDPSSQYAVPGRYPGPDGDSRHRHRQPMESDKRPGGQWHGLWHDECGYFCTKSSVLCISLMGTIWLGTFAGDISFCRRYQLERLRRPGRARGGFAVGHQ